MEEQDQNGKNRNLNKRKEEKVTCRNKDGAGKKMVQGKKG
jgi:hypothetical protein